MANIIRCRQCRTFVYDTASNCHGCGKPVRGGKLLGRGAYVFVALATVAFGIGRGVDLIQSKSRREHAYAVSVRDDHQARSFLESFLRGQDEIYRQWLSPGSAEMATSLRKLRDELPEVLPVSGSIIVVRDRVVDTTMRRFVDSAKKWERMTIDMPVFGLYAVDGASTAYAFEPPPPLVNGPEAEASAEESHVVGVTRARPICIAAKELVNRQGYWGTQRVMIDGQNRQVRVQRWSEKAREYEILASNDARRFRILAAVHIEDGVVRTFRIGRIEDADSGEVILPEQP